MDWNMMDGMMGGFMWFWLIFAVVVLVLLVVGVVWLVRTLVGPGPGGSATSAARQELDLRHARGELTREEYQQRRADLEGRR
jgi:putative membrane protein